ncbi:hypothetical protein [Iodobacter sp.]|uniref:hypothetical protein n=1 Tax=Iodobacter sp. TaxID=1915058 RepID=UPI0025E14A1A|nr:hypothetical protein [Iodobacter sp.]
MLTPPKPHMPEAERQALTTALQQAHSYLEFGMGGSTLLAAWLGVPQIVAIDSSQAWVDKVADQIAGIQTASQTTLLFADIGPTGDWGYPEGAAAQCRWPDYYALAWAAVAEPDLVLIDGRFRVPCFLYSLLRLKPGAVILWDDYAQRPEYHLIEQYLAPSALFGDMAKFIVPSHINTANILNSLFKNLYLVN